MRLTLLVLLACVPSKGSDDSAMDADGDGVSDEHDCAPDDRDWSAVEIWEGDLTLDEAVGLCGGTCGVNVFGDLRVEGTDAVDLDALACVGWVWGDVVVKDNPSLIDLSGLDRLTRIGPPAVVEGRRAPSAESLEIQGNDALERIDGFTSLEFISGSLSVRDNPSLVAIGGFSSLSTPVGEVPGEITIANNGALEEISGFDVLTEVSDLTVAGNGALVDLSAFPALTAVGDLEVRANDALTDISGFNDLRRLDTVTIADNDSIANISGFNNFTSATLWSLEISRSPELSRITGFVGDTPGLADDALVELVDLAALGSLSFLTGVGGLGSLELRGDHALTDLAGLEALTTLREDLDIEDNDGLTDLSALYSLVYVGGDVIVLDNDALPAGAAQELVEQIDTVEGEIEVQE